MIAQVGSRWQAHAGRPRPASRQESEACGSTHHLPRREHPGLTLSPIVQAIQIPLIISEKATFFLAPILGAWIRFRGNGVNLDHLLGSRFRYGWASGLGTPVSTQPMVLGVNLVALVVLLALALAGERGRALESGGDPAGVS